MGRKSIIDNVSFTYEALGSSSYLVATLDEGFDPVNYQMEMLDANEIANILPARKHQKDADVKIYYNATSKLSLSQAISRQKMSKDKFLNLVSGAINAFKEVNEYQLVNTGIVLEPDLIFVNSVTFEPSFVYLPIYTADEDMARLKDFIVSMILKDSIAVSNDNFVQILLSRINSDTLSLADLEKLVSELKKSSSGMVQPVQQPAPGSNNQPPAAVEPIPYPSIKPEPIANSPNVPNAIPIKKDDAKKKQKKAPKEKAERKKPGTRTFIMIGLQVVFVLILIGLMSSSALKTEAGSLDITKVFGALIAIAGIDFVLYRELLVNNNNKEDGEVKQNVAPRKSNVPMPDSKGMGIPQQKAPASPQPVVKPVPQPVQQPIPQPIPQPVQQPIPQPVPVPVQPDINPAISPGSDDTVILSGNSNNTAYLEFFDNGISDRIPLNKSSVIIGRLKGQVDFIINNNNVSKVHAEFISRNGCYFVKDYNSKNGTYINGNPQRITSNMEYQISNNDRIVLADSEFILRC